MSEQSLMLRSGQRLHRFFAACAIFSSLLSGSAFAQGNHQLELLYSDAYDGRGRDDQAVATYKQNNNWSVGDSFFFIDAANLGNYENDGNTYFEWQPRLSIGRLFGDAPLAIGPFREIFLMGEFDHVHNKHVVKNTYLAGISANLALPGFRFFKLALLSRNDPTITGHTQQISLSWNYPFMLGGQGFSIEGFIDASKGEGGTSGNYLAQPQFLWNYNDRLKFGLEYYYWKNKAGVSGFNESAWQAMMRITFSGQRIIQQHSLPASSPSGNSYSAMTEFSRVPI